MKPRILFLTVMFAILGCNQIEDKQQHNAKEQHHEGPTNGVKQECELIELDIVNRSDFTKRKDIESPSGFDSLDYHWSGDTLYLDHFFFKVGTCGKFQFQENPNVDTIAFDFYDENQCELATYFQIQAKILIHNKSNKPIYYGKSVIKSTLH